MIYLVTLIAWIIIGLFYVNFETDRQLAKYNYSKVPSGPLDIVVMFPILVIIFALMIASEIYHDWNKT